MLVFTMILCGNVLLHAEGTLKLSGVPKSMDIGHEFTITVATPEGTATMYIAYPADLLEYTGSSEGSDCLGGAGNRKVNPINGSATLSFKATATGSGKITVTSENAGDDEGNDTTFSPISASFTVNNKTTDNGGNTGGNTGNNNNGGGSNGNTATEKKSSDNSLKSLTISPGTLSPKFKYSTTSYKASVGENVTSIAVDAEQSNSKATIESVTGNTNLKMGENTVKITVKAEDGTVAVYKIVVTRAAATGGDTEKPGTTEEPADNPAHGNEDGEITFNGIAYEVSATLPKATMPTEFTKTHTTYDGENVEVYYFPNGKLYLFYLTPVNEDTETEGGFFLYDEEKEEFFPYINITMGQKYALMLPGSFAETIPEGYEEAALTIGEYTITAYQPTAEEETENEFYLVYGVDKKGNLGWYQYDSEDESLQRFNEGGYAAAEAQEKADAYEKAYTELNDKYNEERVTSRKIMAVLIFLLVVAIFAIINILLFKSSNRGGKSRSDRNEDEEMDFVDLDDVDDV